MRKKLVIMDFPSLSMKTFDSGAHPLSFMDLPKIKKTKQSPPIAIRFGRIGHHAARFPTSVVGFTKHHVMNRRDFVQKLRGFKVLPSRNSAIFWCRCTFYPHRGNRRRLSWILAAALEQTSTWGWDHPSAGVVPRHDLFHVQRGFLCEKGERLTDSPVAHCRWLVWGRFPTDRSLSGSSVGSTAPSPPDDRWMTLLP